MDNELAAAAAPTEPVTEPLSAVATGSASAVAADSTVAGSARVSPPRAEVVAARLALEQEVVAADSAADSAAGSAAGSAADSAAGSGEVSGEVIAAA
eukprot:scaffold30036_cov37-Phaeocystis_antarctica.AAC.2